MAAARKTTDNKKETKPASKKEPRNLAARKDTPKKTAVKKAAPKKAVKTKTEKPAITETVAVTGTEKKEPRQIFTNKVLYTVAAILGLAGLLYLARGLFVAATVNGYPITRIAFIREMEKYSGKDTLDSMVSKQLIYAEARKRGVSVTEDDMNKEIENINKQLESQGTTLEEALKTEGRSLADVKDTIRIRKLIEKMFEKEVEVTDDEVKKFFDENKQFYTDKKLEDVRDSIKDNLRQQEIDAKLNAWLTEAKNNAKVNYFVQL